LSIGLLIADDHELVRAGLRQAFARSDVVVVGEASTATEALSHALDSRVQVMLLDVTWISQDELTLRNTGFDLLEQIRSLRPELPILMYSAHDEARYIGRCYRLGASGYLIKGVDDALLVNAVRAVSLGEQIWPDIALEGAGRTALVMHHDDAVAKSTAMLLRAVGFTVWVCSDCADACSLLLRTGQPPTILFCGYHLSGSETGIDAIHAIRAASHQEIPAVLFSGDTSAGMLERTRNVRDCSLLRVPFDLEELLGLIERLARSSALRARTVDRNRSGA
jgi:DNA-binding NarL/FixJ family response regulator